VAAVGIRVSVVAALSILLISGLFSTVSNRSFSFVSLSQQYAYFVPLTALSATVTSWDAELISGLGERGPAVLLSGGFSASGHFGLERLKLGCEALLALLILRYGSRARRSCRYP
jgi:hypothetical protein